MHKTLRALALLMFTALAACGRSSEPAAVPGPAAATPAASIDWREGQVDEAFAVAREQNKPVLLYWGAAWCPPCNRLKSTVFLRPDFIEQSRQFVAVHLDGDAPGAQRWGEHFGVFGYPTMIVLRPDRTEIMRLSGGTDVEQYARLLGLAHRQTATIAQLRDRAVFEPAKLSTDDWTLLANYGWEVDEDRVATMEQAATLLGTLATTCPVNALRPRFAILALSMRLGLASDPHTLLRPEQQKVAQDLLVAVLQHPAQLKANHVDLTYGGAKLVAAAAPDPRSEARTRLAGALVTAMDRVYADTSLPLRDRLDAVLAEVELARIDDPAAALPPALVDKVHARVSWADAEARTPYERQAVIGAAAELLGAVDDRAGAERLLLAELPKSTAPYYYMPDLSDLAEKRGDKAQAIDWLRKAYESSEGPATRAQWGLLYARGLVEMRPEDAGAIETVLNQVIDEIAVHPETFYQRTRSRFAKLDPLLRDWGRTHRGEPTLARLQQRMSGVCAKLPAGDAPARTGCEHWLRA